MSQAFLRATFFACSAILAFAQSTASVPFQATTQTVEGSTLHLRGNVQIGNAQTSIIQADEVDFNVATGAIEARGNVRFPWGTSTIRVDSMSGSLRSEGWFYNRIFFTEKPPASLK